MATLLFGVVVLALLLWASQAFATVDPRKLAPVVKLIGGAGALGGAAFLAARGQFGLAIPLGLTGLGLLGWIPWGPAGFGARIRRSSGQSSRVRSAFVEMELDHDTGALRGRILAGTHEGVSLDALPVPTLVALMAGIDAESRALLAAYLDRRDPSWREHADEDAGAGRSGSARSSGPMTEQEAYQILGVEPGASAAEIGRAHRGLMKKLHPDQGGSTYLAARINEAKDVLLRRHR
jgi:hypothetical protein